MTEREDYKAAFYLLFVLFIVSFVVNVSFIYNFTHGPENKTEPKKELFQNYEPDTTKIEE